MKTLVLDTNALLRFLLKDIPSQTEEVKKQIKLAKQGQIRLIITTPVIFEIVYALVKYYNLPKEQVVAGLKKVITFKYLEILDKEVMHDALDLYLIKNLSFVDCYLLKYAHHLNAELFTFDKQLNKNDEDYQDGLKAQELEAKPEKGGKTISELAKKHHIKI